MASMGPSSNPDNGFTTSFTDEAHLNGPEHQYGRKRIADLENDLDKCKDIIMLQHEMIGLLQQQINGLEALKALVKKVHDRCILKHISPKDNTSGRNKISTDTLLRLIQLACWLNKCRPGTLLPDEAWIHQLPRQTQHFEKEKTDAAITDDIKVDKVDPRENKVDEDRILKNIDNQLLVTGIAVQVEININEESRLPMLEDYTDEDVRNLCERIEHYVTKNYDRPFPNKPLPQRLISEFMEQSDNILTSIQDWIDYKKPVITVPNFMAEGKKVDLVRHRLLSAGLCGYGGYNVPSETEWKRDPERQLLIIKNLIDDENRGNIFKGKTVRRNTINGRPVLNTTVKAGLVKSKTAEHATVGRATKKRKEPQER